MQNADQTLQEITHRNATRVQAGMERMLDGKAIQIEGAQFRLRLRCSLTGESANAMGLVLVGRDERGEWLPCHS